MDAGRSNPRRRGRCQRGRKDQPEGREHQLDQGGGRDDPSDAYQEEGGRSQRKGQSGQEREVNVPDGQFSSEGTSEDQSGHAKQPLSDHEVRQRIREGQARRRHMKKGIAKRLLGNARAIVAGVFVATMALAGAAQQAVPYAARIRPDVVEISGNQAYVSQSFSRWGWRAVRPVDLVSDLSEHRSREQLSQWIRETHPRLVVMTDCYPLNHGNSVRFGVNRAQAERRERKKSERCHDVCQFMHDVCENQMSRGNHVILDLPVSGEGYTKEFSETMRKHPRIQCVQGCHPTRRKCVWATSCDRIADEIGQVTMSGAHHDPDSSADTCRKQIARAICRGYVRYLREVDPGRIRRMLRSVSAMIRRKVHEGDPEVHELRWNEKNVTKALKQWSAVYAQDDGIDDDDDRELIPDLEELDGGQSDHHMEDQARDAEAPSQAVKAKLASHGISFEVPPGRRLSEAVRHGLVKAHCNLGHPSREDLARFLKLGGAKQEVVEAVSWMKCITCAHARRPATHRTTNIPPCQLAFGDEVQLDCVCIRDAKKENHWFLSILDRATSYHMLELMRDHSPAELHRAFERGWTKWAGCPMKITFVTSCSLSPNQERISLL